MAVDVMRRYFDRPWWQEALARNRSNQVLASLLGKGTMVLSFIAKLGADLQRLERAPGFVSKLSALKAEGSGSLLLEIFTAGLFARAGLGISFPPAGQDHRSPDLMVNGPDGCTAMECKKLEFEEWEKWAHGLMSNAIRFLPPGAPEGVAVEIALSERLSEIRTRSEECPGLNEMIANEIVRRLHEVVASAVANATSLPMEFDIPGLGRGRLLDGTEEHTSVGGFAISPVAQMRRILTNGLYRALDQLPSDLPGMIIVETEYLPELPFAQLAFDAATKTDPLRFNKVVALLVLPACYLGCSLTPLLLTNRVTPYATKRLSAIEVVRRALRPSEWPTAQVAPL